MSLFDAIKYRHMAFESRIPKCEWCGNKDTLEIDHIDENRNNNIPQNLRILCHKCHLKRHNIREKKKYNGKYAKGTRKNKRK